MPEITRTADGAVEDISDGAVVAVTGSGGGILEPDDVLAALERRFLATGRPRDLTLIHALGIGDRDKRGVNRLAHRGLVARVIGGHWTWSPRMQDLARRGEIEAYALPTGVISLALRELGGHRAGLITRTGLHTFADPRHGGGLVGGTATEELVRLVTLDEREFLRYLLPAVDVAVIRGSEADASGAVGCRTEAAQLDVLALAQAAHASGGKVIAQVKEVLAEPLDPRAVAVPGPLVDTLVVAPGQWQTYAAETDRELFEAGSAGRPASTLDPVRGVIARRAALELSPGSVVNLGFGLASQVADVLAAEGRLGEVTLAVEQGLFGGSPLGGDLFGASRFPTARVPSTTQFDLFAQGLLDVACLGMAEADRTGSVNVSAFGGRIVGPGGFVDISQYARKVVFCGTFLAGRTRKFVDAVEQVTYSGPFAAAEGREAVYVTERAVFRLTAGGLELAEVAPGVDVERDVLAHMGFRPVVRSPAPMPAHIFEP